MKIYSYVLLAGIILTACSQGTPVSPAATAVFQRADAPGLPREHAVYRAGLVSNVNYELSFKLDETATEFSGKATITFTLKEANAPLTLDFTGGKIASFTINGTSHDAKMSGERFIDIPKNILIKGQNRIEATFTHPYSTTSSGLYRFKDPEDGKVYAYTDLEPYQANQVYPCFDQPDLKAHFTLAVDAPATWHVISATQETAATDSGTGRKSWQFPKSPLMSTYVFAIHAGEYVSWSAKTEDDIPLRLFARQSLAKYVDVAEWLDLTKRGLAFYQKYFGTAYPFKKYDQLLVPDFNWGGMENVGAVTFNEKRYIFRGKPTLIDRERRASTILHEMAHMWFGDLVTMRWWDDLWLNESFATLMATTALVDATEYKGAWETFFARNKAGAYYEDGLSTTHPIASAVPDTEQAGANFDNITYGKGAATLKQLAFTISQEKFQAGLKKYFDTHSFGNATLADFFAAMSAASDKDLSDWSRSWIETTGFDALATQTLCENGKVTSFVLAPKPNDPNAAKPHRTQITLYDANGKAGRSAVVAYQSDKTSVPEFRGAACPAFAYANANDQDYVKLILDQQSTDAAMAALATIEEPLTRLMLWRDLWDRVRDGVLPFSQYAETVNNQLPKEPDFRITQAVSGTLVSEKPFIPSLYRYVSLGSDATKPLRDATRAKIQEFLWHAFQSSNPDSDEQRLWFDTFVRFAGNADAAQKLLAALAGKELPANFVVDQDRRWNILVKLCELNVTGADKLVAQEELKDASSVGKSMALTAKAAFTGIDGKIAWLDKIADEKSAFSSADFKSVMNGLFPLTQVGERLALAGRYYDVLVKIAPKRDYLFLETYVQAMTPTACQTETARELKQFIDAHPELPPIVIKNLKNAREEDRRCLTVQDTALAAAPTGAVGTWAR